MIYVGGFSIQVDRTLRWEGSIDFSFISMPFFYFHSPQVKAKGTLMQMVAADWLRSDKREDDLAGRPGSIVQVNS